MLRFKAGYMIATGFSHSSIYNLAHGPGPYMIQQPTARRMLERAELHQFGRKPARSSKPGDMTTTVAAHTRVSAH